MRGVFLLAIAAATAGCILEDNPDFDSTSGTDSGGGGGSGGMSTSTTVGGTDGFDTDGGGGGGLEPVGYQARPCGLDLDDDGVLGERDDDCRLCDGLTADPDGDGTDEDLFYVDCDRMMGAVGNCGAPDSPCIRVADALSQLDGAADGAEDIICVRGTCSAQDLLLVSGVSRIRPAPATGREVRAFEYPADPMMVVGWDTDADGEYPPFDSDEVASFDGTGLDGRLFRLSGSADGVPAASHVEVAHLVVANYGRVSPGTTGFISVGEGGPISTHVYVHDLSVLDVNRNRKTATVFDWAGPGGRHEYYAVHNVEVLNYGGWLMNNDTLEPASEDGPYRFRNVTATMQGCASGQAGLCAMQVGQETTDSGGWRAAGYVTGVEILDSVLDARSGMWNPTSPVVGVAVSPCNQDWSVQNNRFIDVAHGLEVRGAIADVCDGPVARVVDQIAFVANVVANDYDWGDGFMAVRVVATSRSTAETVADVRVANNFLSSLKAGQRCAFVSVGNTQAANPGRFSFVNNTCMGAVPTADGAVNAAVMLLQPSGASVFPYQNFVMRNNVVVILGEGNNVLSNYAPVNFSAGNNVFTDGAGYVWDSIQLDFANWSVRSQSNGSKQCFPSFVDAGSGDYHLAADDDCAIAVGEAVSEIAPLDIDGDMRPDGGPWDAGADQRQ